MLEISMLGLLCESFSNILQIFYIKIKGEKTFLDVDMTCLSIFHLINMKPYKLQ